MIAFKDLVYIRAVYIMKLSNFSKNWDIILFKFKQQTKHTGRDSLKLLHEHFLNWLLNKIGGASEMYVQKNFSNSFSCISMHFKVQARKIMIGLLSIQ